MPQFATGTAPGNIPPIGLLGDVAFLHLAELLALTGAVYTVEQLRGNAQVTATAVIITDVGQRGLYVYEASDTSTADDGLKTLVTSAGRRYTRLFGRMRQYTPTSSTDANVLEGEWTYDSTNAYTKVGGNIRKIAHQAF